MNRLGERNHLLAGSSALNSCSNTAVDTSPTTRTHKGLPPDRSAMNSIANNPVPILKLAPMLVSIGAPVLTIVTNRQRVCVP